MTTPPDEKFAAEVIRRMSAGETLRWVSPEIHEEVHDVPMNIFMLGKTRLSIDEGLIIYDLLIETKSLIVDENTVRHGGVLSYKINESR